MLKPKLKLDEVVFLYGSNGAQPFVLGPLTFELGESQILVVLGPSGCGKTTLLRLISGLEISQRGSVWIGDRLVSGRNTHVQPEKRGVGMVFQELALFPHLNVSQNVGFGLGRTGAGMRTARVAECLELVGLGGFERRYPHELSGGQKQRVALARALAPQPALILLDEPFSSLDADLRRELASDIHRVLRETRSTTILVTHDHEEAFSMADRVAVLKDGGLVQWGNPFDVYHLPVSRFVAEFMGPAVFVEGRVEKGGIHCRFGNFRNQTDLPEGTPVDVLLRPDDVELEPSDSGEAAIVARKFHGSENIYTVELSTGERILSTQRSHWVYPEGERVHVRAELEHVVVFRREELL
ncbi:MAG: ABC transporter ATP-binding protein [Candidatus Omnitrophica bacterium]|nr:ABC transporter ATP-binding protein [Candidatus Omnitrophota bacterium]